MPNGLCNLRRLHSLSHFLVGEKRSNSSWKQLFDALEDLEFLDNLQGHLNIVIRCPNATYFSKEDAMRIGLYPLQSKERLKAIQFDFKQAEGEKVIRLMKELQPHPNLQYLKVWRYNGVSMGWDTFPANLVELVMVGCWELKFLPCLGNLPPLKVLKLLNLKKLEPIIIQDSPWANSKEDATKKGLYPLQSQERLKAIEFDGGLDIEEETTMTNELQLPSNSQYLKAWRYNDVRIGEDTFPLNLVELVMVGCWELKFLTCLGNLPHLKVLHLSNLKKLECIIIQDSQLANSSSAPTSRFGSEELSSCYPSLETLLLENLPMLKGWSSGAVDDHLRQVLNDEGGSGSSTSSNSDNKAQWQLLLRFSRLKSLFIWNCQELTWIPLCPAVEDLKLVHFNSTLRIVKGTASGEHFVDGVSSSASCNDIDIPESSCSRRYIQNAKKIRKVVISNVAWLNWLPVEAFVCLESLKIWCDKEVESLTEVEEVFRSYSSSLKFLIIHNCSNLKSVVRGGLKHLTKLEKLELRNCDNLTLLEEDGDGEEREDGIGIGPVKWPSNFHALHSSKLEGLPQLVNLPDWMQFLPALETLCICFCCGLKSMPAWMTELTSLRKLVIISCSASLESRCKENPPGEDWPYIQHIPNIEFRDCGF